MLEKEHRIAYFQKDAFGALTFQEPCIQWRQKHIMTGKLLPSHNFCNRPLMRFIRFASNIGPAAAVPAGPALAPRHCRVNLESCVLSVSQEVFVGTAVVAMPSA